MPQPFKRKWKVQRRWQIWKGECKKVDKRITKRKKKGGDQKVWTIASLWPVKITPWRLQGRWGQSREGSQVFQSSEGNSSCLTKSLHPRWPNLYALSSLLLSVFFMFVKASHDVVSDLADLGRHAYLYIQFPLCKWTLLVSVLISLSLCSTLQLKRFLHYMFARVWKYRHPHVEGLVNHTVVRGKICLFLFLFLLRFGNTS